MKLSLFFLISCGLLFASGPKQISPIDKKIEQRMRSGHSYRNGCSIPLKDLRYLRIPYRGFDGKRHLGEMIVHKDVAREVVRIFDELYRQGYPIRRMQLVSDYGGSDWKSIEADNTSAFNCRPVTGGKKWSRHAYGKAIDINPLENPYISRSRRIAHKASLPYRKRVGGSSPQRKAVILPNSPVVRSFKSRGWRWGGDWHTIKDYQHFDKKK
ncbi:M15 family metallopeptidase [Nitratifractor sp.]